MRLLGLGQKKAAAVPDSPGMLVLEMYCHVSALLGPNVT